MPPLPTHALTHLETNTIIHTVRNSHTHSRRLCARTAEKVIFSCFLCLARSCETKKGYRCRTPLKWCFKRPHKRVCKGVLKHTIFTYKMTALVTVHQDMYLTFISACAHPGGKGMPYSAPHSSSASPAGSRPHSPKDAPSKKQVVSVSVLCAHI